MRLPLVVKGHGGGPGVLIRNQQVLGSNPSAGSSSFNNLQKQTKNNYSVCCILAALPIKTNQCELVRKLVFSGARILYSPPLFSSDKPVNCVLAS